MEIISDLNVTVSKEKEIDKLFLIFLEATSELPKKFVEQEISKESAVEFIETFQNSWEKGQFAEIINNLQQEINKHQQIEQKQEQQALIELTEIRVDSNKI